MRLAPIALAVACVASCRRFTHDEPLPPVAPTASSLASASAPAPVDASAFAVVDASAATAPAASVPALPDVRTDWCLEGWRGLDEGTCYLVPQGWEQRGSKRLLVYLSGIVPPVPKSAQKENVQRIVASAAKRAGVVVILPRGRRGIGPVDARDWWAWPTSSGDYERYARALVSEWNASRAKLEAALGRFDRTYLAGSSSGAYFLTALAFAGAVEMDGYAALSGGSVGSGLARDAGSSKKPPFYVGYGTADPTNGGPKALGVFLASSGWPVEVRAHPVGHGAREVYLDEAFTFWDSASEDGAHR